MISKFSGDILSTTIRPFSSTLRSVEKDPGASIIFIFTVICHSIVNSGTEVHEEKSMFQYTPILYGVYVVYRQLLAAAAFVRTHSHGVYLSTESNRSREVQPNSE